MNIILKPKISHLNTLIFVALLIAFLSAPIFAQDQETSQGDKSASKIDPEKTPWLQGVTLPPVPVGPAPIYTVDISGVNGSPLPATLSEDIPIYLSAQSEIFGNTPPGSWKDQHLTNVEWSGATSIHWFFDDVRQNKSMLASCEENLPMNQMKVTPLDPCSKGAVSVFLSRPFKYEEKPGQLKTIFANGSKALHVKVTDITPPTCGLEVTSDGGKGIVWAVETPANKYPLPKTADVHFKGTVFSQAGTEVDSRVAGIELGTKMVLAADQCNLFLSKDKEINLKVVLQDNDRVDENSVKYGICEVVNNQPVLVGEANPTTIKPKSLKLPEKPYFFIEAMDPSGNHQVMCVPVTFK